MAEGSREYWRSRSGRIGGRSAISSRIKRFKFLQPLLWTIASLRVRNEMFVSDALDRYGAASVLDVACGAGQDLVSVGRKAIGVDLPNAPKEIAFSRGYSAYTHFGEDGSFDLDDEVDAIVCINLNAHIAPELFTSIIANSVRHLREGGPIILVNEYNNDGFSYRRMKTFSMENWREMVRRMDHGYLEYEQPFVERMKALGYIQAHREALTGAVLPAAHYRWFLGAYGQTPLSSLGCLALDLPLSLINAGTTHASKPGAAFLVGHIFERA